MASSRGRFGSSSDRLMQRRIKARVQPGRAQAAPSGRFAVERPPQHPRGQIGRRLGELAVDLGIGQSAHQVEAPLQVARLGAVRYCERIETPAQGMRNMRGQRGLAGARAARNQQWPASGQGHVDRQDDIAGLLFVVDIDRVTGTVANPLGALGYRLGAAAIGVEELA